MKLKHIAKYLALFVTLGLSHALLATTDFDQTVVDEFQIQKINIAKKVEKRAELYKVNSNTIDNEMVITRPGASFIKVHFEKLNLPSGAYVEVSNMDGTEVYRYAKDKRSPFTYDAESGEDGRHSFSAMSINGDTAIVRLIGKNANFNPNLHRAVVDSFMQGFTEAEIQDALNASLQKSPDGNDFTTESTCGVNERRDVACWETSHPVEFERSRPVARILIGGASLCTAWRVGANNHMFTNNHCVDTQSGVQNTEVWFNYQRTSCNGSLGTTTKVTGAALLQTDFNLDYSLYTVNNFSSIQSFGHFGLDVREAIDNEIIYIPQHGSGNPKELAIESDQNDGGLCRIDDVSANGYATDSDMGYFCDTIGGSSGSPVLAASSNNVIALHHFGGCTNQGVKISNIWPQVSGFFGGAIPVGDNGGSSSPTASYIYSCSLTSCSFNGSGSSDSDGTIVAYAWDFGDGATASGATVSHDFGVSGNFDVSLTVTDDENNTGTTNQTVSVDDGTSPPAAPSNLVGTAVKQGKGKKAVTLYVDLSWSDNSNNETGFTIERCIESGKGKNKVCNFSASASVTADVSSYRDNSVPSGTVKYRVKADGNGGSGYSNTVKP